MTADIGRTGLWVFNTLVDPQDPEHRDALAEVDELGYGALWLGNAEGDLKQVAGVLDATERIVVATGIVKVWMQSAAELTRAYRDVPAQQLDRLLLGLGSSHAPLVEGETGQRYAKPYSKLVSYLDELDAEPNPVPHESLALAALGPRTLALAGERTKGAHPYLTTPEHTAQAREILGSGPLLAPEQKVVLESDPDRARAIAREGVAFYLELPNYLNNWRRMGYEEADFADGGSDRLIDQLVAWGELDDVVRRINEHHEAGADHVTLQVLNGQPGLPRQEWRRLAEALR